MARLVLLLVLATIVATASAKIMFDRKVAPPKWTKHAVAADDTPLKFFVALRQRNLDVLEKTFWAVAEPTSPQYRQFLQPEQIMDIVRPAPHDHSRAMHWLRSNGVKTIRDLGDALEVKTTVGVASELFNTQFFHFTHQNGKKVVRQWGPYSVDDQVADAIHMVAGITEFPVPRPKLKRTVNSPSIDPAVVPQTIQAVYGTPDSAQDAGNSSQGVIEWEGEYFAPLNLQAFSKEMATPIKALPANRIIGPNEPSNPGTEAELDIQYIAAVGQGVDNWFWSNDGTAWLYGWAVDFFNATEVPLVVSMSYGWSEDDQCENGIGQSECQQLGVDSTGYVERVNAEFQKIGLRGVSLLAASGDSGANGRTDGYCTKPKLLPDYPAASPYVTSVGATQLNDAKASLPTPPPACSSIQCASGGTEVAVSYAVAQFASGGGFSNVAATPSYQQAAVTAYLNSGVALPPTTYFNSSGRGYPDIAAFGNNVYIYEGGLEGVGGTSCASPIVAGVVGLLNIAALQKDGQPLGFLNPLLYQIAAQQPSAFTDITVGDNKCTEDGCSLSCKGYECAAGWDPVTGLGSPNYPALLQYIQNNL